MHATFSVGSLAVHAYALTQLATGHDAGRFAVDWCAWVAHRGRSELPRGPVDGKRSRKGSPRASTGLSGGEGCHGRSARNVQKWAWLSTRGRGWVYGARRVSSAGGSTAKARAPGGCSLGPNLSVIVSTPTSKQKGGWLVPTIRCIPKPFAHWALTIICGHISGAQIKYA